MTRNPRALVLAGLAACYLFGALTGLALAPRGAAPPEASPSAAIAAAAPARQGAPRLAPGPSQRAAAAPIPSALPAPRPTPPAAEASATPRPALDWSARLGALEEAAARPDDIEAQRVAEQARLALSETISQDLRARDEAIAQLRRADPGAAAELAALLGRLRDPEVEQAAISLVTPGNPLAQRLAGFDILDALDAPGALGPALAALNEASAPELRRAALRAIPDGRGLAAEAAPTVRAQLERVLSEDPDPESRRRAAILIAGWASTDDDLAGVLAALRLDRDVNVRAGCAYACEISGLRSPQLIAALTELLSRPNEDPLVHENAAHALRAQGPLPAEARRQLEAWQQRQVPMDGVGAG